MGDWVSGLGSPSAALVAVVALLRELRDRRRHEEEAEQSRFYERRAQASKGFIEPPTPLPRRLSDGVDSCRTASIWSTVYNNSDGVINDLVVTLEMQHRRQGVYPRGRVGREPVNVSRVLPRGRRGFEFVWEFGEVLPSDQVRRELKMSE
jgi:hypothetical protein